MSPLTSYGVQRRLRSQSMVLTHFYPPNIGGKNNTMKTKDIKGQKYTLIPGEGFEISTKLERILRKRGKKSMLHHHTPLTNFQNDPQQFKWDKSCRWRFDMWFLFSDFLQGAVIMRNIHTIPKKSDHSYGLWWIESLQLWKRNDYLKRNYSQLNEKIDIMRLKIYNIHF